MFTDTEALLRESGWVRALAHRLAEDHQRADDLAQETLVAALQRPRAEGVPLRRWLAAVMRNLWRQERRGELRRVDREVRVSLPEADGAEPTSDLVARLEGHRAVVNAVLELHEPYRSVLVARYFDGLAPRAIAQRRGLPVRTVHTQLARALVLLRARLERAHAGRHGAWLPILGLLMGVERPGGLVGTTLRALMMDMKLKAAMGVAALAGLAFVARPIRDRPVEVASAAPVATVAPAAARADQSPELDEPTGAGIAREAVEGEVRPVPEPAPVLPAGLALRAVDPEGRPVVGLALRCAGQEDVHSTDAEGLVTLPCADKRAVPQVVDERWTTVGEPLVWWREGSAINELVVAPLLHLGGRIVDEAGTPLAGAQVRVYLPLFTAQGVPEPLHGSRTRTWTTASDANGDFRLEAGLLPGGLLVARHPGHRTELGPQPTHSDPTLRIELETLEPGDDLLGGLVVDASGAPVEGARVALGLEHARSDARGRFLIGLPEHDELGVLTALVPGSLPARLERAAPSDRDPAAWPDPLILRLGAVPLAITGRVLDAAGEPVAGARVRVLDPTHFGAVEWGDSEGFTMQGFVESLLAGQTGRLEARTDERGVFEIEGLLPRAYTLSADHAESMSQVESGPVEAGVSGLVLRLPVQELRERVAGRVLGLDGEPIVGATVALRGRGPHFAPVGAPYLTYGDPMYGPSGVTDADGRFSFDDVPLAVTELQVDGSGLVLGQTFGLSSGDDAEDLELRVARSCKLEVDLTDSGVGADNAEILGADGERLGLAITMGEMTFASDSASLHGGRSGVLSVSEAAQTLVLYTGGVEVLRRRVWLVPGKSNVVRP